MYVVTTDTSGNVRALSTPQPNVAPRQIITNQFGLSDRRIAFHVQSRVGTMYGLGYVVDEAKHSAQSEPSAG
jgi:hypothetical protein